MGKWQHFQQAIGRRFFVHRCGQILGLGLAAWLCYVLHLQPWPVLDSAVQPSPVYGLYALLAAGVCGFLPRYRWSLLRFFTICGWFFLPWFFLQGWQGKNPAAFVLVLLILFAGMGAYRQWLAPRLKHPLACLLVVILVWQYCQGFYPANNLLRTLAWQGLFLCAAFFWYFALNLVQPAAKKTFWQQAGGYLPFWGGSQVPFAKGTAYLARIEIKGRQAYAEGFVSALCLVALAALYHQLGAGLLLLRQHWALPDLFSALLQVSTGKHYLFYQAWLILLFDFLIKLARLASWGHLAVALIRIAGFMAVKNTDQPLASATIAEFWNRYYYYFKELLVACFFYPTYFRYFKSRPRWRLFFATFMAAGVGNFLYHLLAYMKVEYQIGTPAFLSGVKHYALYCALLSGGIALSQLRKNRPARPLWWRWTITPGVVLGFYLLISVFAMPFNPLPMSADWQFLGSAFGA